VGFVEPCLGNRPREGQREAILAWRVIPAKSVSGQAECREGARKGGVPILAIKYCEIGNDIRAPVKPYWPGLSAKISGVGVGVSTARRCAIATTIDCEKQRKSGAMPIIAARVTDDCVPRS
jgi:hypothetical protein